MKKILGIVIVLLAAAFVYVLFSPDDYYEYDADSASQCAPGEEYDSEFKVCYFDFYCETDVECGAIDAKYGQVLDSLALEYQQDDHDYHDADNAESGDDADSEAQPVESVASQDTRITNIMQALIPADQLAQITQIVTDSDGRDGTLAYVEPVATDGSEWKMAYDPVDSFTTNGQLKNPKELLTTLIHEFAHVLALNNQQVVHVGSDVQTISCADSEIIIDEGCAKTGSYLTLFVNSFWTTAERERATQAQAGGTEEDYSFELYNKSPNDFVTEYAATNAVEDFAESFALFVMQSARPTSDLVKDQKIASFYSYEEFVSLRKHMRGGVLKILQTK